MATSETALKTRIYEDMKTAMRAQDKGRLAVIRLIMAAIKQREVDERTSLDDREIIKVLTKMIKQRRESISQYQAAGRQELAQQEEFEMGIIQAYLPAALSDDDIDQIIEEAIASTGASSPKDMGSVMGAVKKRTEGRADLAAVSAKVKERLSGPAH